MDLRRGVWIVVGLLVLSLSLSSAGDIVHHDNIALKRPGCENNFVLGHGLLQSCLSRRTKVFFDSMSFTYAISRVRLKIEEETIAFDVPMI